MEIALTTGVSPTSTVMKLYFLVNNEQLFVIHTVDTLPGTNSELYCIGTCHMNQNVEYKVCAIKILQYRISTRNVS